MDQKEIDALEPKYTGNQRNLTEGEAAAIKADPNYKAENEEGTDEFSTISAVGFLGLNRTT